MAELADALASGASRGNSVKVQVLLSALHTGHGVPRLPKTPFLFANADMAGLRSHPQEQRDLTGARGKFMPKKEFQVQHYFLKWIGALPLLLAALLIEYFISQHTDSDIVFYLACAVTMIVLLSAYYLIVAKLHLFEDKGYFWEDGEVVVIEIGKRRYEISDVRCLIGGEPNIFMYCYAHLLIEMPKKKIKIFGQTLRGDMEFGDSDLYPLFQLILDKNRELKPKKMFKTEVDNWYEK